MRAFNRVVYKGPVMGLAATGPLTPIDTWELLGSARSLVLQLRLLRTAAPASGSLTITLETSNDGDLWFQSALTPFAVLTGLLSTDFRTVTQVNGCFVRFRFGWLVAGDAGQLWVGASGRISREAQERKTDCGCGNKTDQTSAPALQDPSDVVGRQWLPPGALRKALGAAHPRSLAGALPVGRGGSGEPGPRDEPRGIVPRGQVPPPIVVVRRPRDSSEVPTLPVPCLGLTTLPQDRLLGRFEAADRAGSRLPDGVRVQGAWIAPLNRVVVAYPGYRRGVSRLWVASVGTAPCGRDFGRPAGPPALALTGTEAMQGVSSTSVRNPDGSVDAVFAVWDSLAGGSIRVFSVSGRDGAPGATTTVVQSVVTSRGVERLVGALAPSVSVGRAGAESKILLAFQETQNDPTGTSNHYINVGFLTRDGSGGWRFSSTALIPTSDDQPCSPLYNVAAAWDGQHQEWGLAWFCSQDNHAVFLARVFFDGRSSRPTPSFAADFPGDPPHSGVVLSYNRRTDRYLVQLQHDVFWARRSRDQLRCLDESGEAPVSGACGGPGVRNASRLVGPWSWNSQVDVGTGGVWATAVDYAPGREFRLGGQSTGPLSCVDDEGCGPDESCGPPTGPGGSRSCVGPAGAASNPGLTFASRAGTNEWRTDFPRLWSGAAATATVALHQYVRVPAEGIDVAVVVATDARYSYGDVRYTFLAAEAPYAFDE